MIWTRLLDGGILIVKCKIFFLDIDFATNNPL